MGAGGHMTVFSHGRHGTTGLNTPGGRTSASFGWRAKGVR